MRTVAAAAIVTWSSYAAGGASEPGRERFVVAHELQIRNSPERVKVRSPWAVALLPIITLGIYHLVWWYRINRELRDYGRSKGYDLGQNPTASLLALFPGGIIIVPALVSYWRGTKRVQGAARIGGTEPPNGWVALILYLLIALGFYSYLQVSLNDLWRSEADLLPGQAPLPPLPDTMPPRLAEQDQSRSEQPQPNR